MLNGLDLFSGIGGLTLALSQWVRPLAYCEQDRYCQAVLLNRMHERVLPRAPIWDDIRTFRAGQFAGVDIIYGGFPCQDVSTAGLRAGVDGQRTGLFREAVRLIREYRPKFVFLENVAGIRKYVSTVRGELEALGYDCRDGFLSAAEVGAIHVRGRWWLLAHANDKRGRQEQIKIKGSSHPAESRNDGQTRTTTNIISERLQSERDERDAHKTGGSTRFAENFNDSRSQKCGWWRVEPNVGRMVHGLPNRVDRIKGLGNAVVPICATEAFKILMGIKGVKQAA